MNIHGRGAVMSTEKTKLAPTVTEFVDSLVQFKQRRGVCIKCGLVYNGIKVKIRCPKCQKLIETEEKCDMKVVTGLWVRMSDFRSDQHLF